MCQNTITKLMENKRTAIDWLFLMINNPNDNQELALKCFKKAKEMHKEETCQFVSDYLDDGQDLTAEEYYEQIFKLEKL